MTQKVIAFVLGLLLSMSAPLSVWGLPVPEHQSTNYGVDEFFIGAGGTNDANSSSYNARASLGELGVGESSSTNYGSVSGFTTSDEPFLEFVVNTSTVDLGEQSSSSTSTGTAEFYIRNYLSDGYAVVTASEPPRNGGTLINALSSPTGPSVGTEQFGINLVANTSPSSFGANPVQVPDATFSFGQAATGYNTANQFKYVQGDTVASSAKSSGQTTYTISYIMNISDVTAGGIYTMNHELVAVPTY